MKDASMDPFFDNLPNLHIRQNPDGGYDAGSGGFNSEFLKVIQETITQQLGNAHSLRYIETGAGLSTLLFLYMGAERVTSIATDLGLFQRIISAAEERNIDHTPLRFEVGMSEFSLPKIAEETNISPQYDVALIDGDHGWPAVFVDFCYLNYALRKGGLLLLDDVNTYSVMELVKFLDAEPSYEKIWDTGHHKLIIFKKCTADRFTSGAGRPYLIAQTQAMKKTPNII